MPDINSASAKGRPKGRRGIRLRPETKPPAGDAPMLAAALAHAAAGRSIFPCAADKKPLTRNGFKDASRDPETIRRWWTQYPEALIGMPTGKANGVFVLDVDNDPATGKDGDASLAALEQAHGRLPDTAESMTPRGGRHLIFRHPGSEFEVPNSAGKLGANLDIRGDGGYVILPPSKIPDGRCYQWEGSSNPDEGVRAAEAPAWLLTLVIKQDQAPTVPTGPIADSIPDGQRNETLFALGRSLRAKGLTDAGILAALHAENAARCSPPLSDAEVQTIAASAAKKAPGHSLEFDRQHPRPRLAVVSGVPRGTQDEPPPEGVTEWIPDADDDIAQAFIAERPDLRYVAAWGKWLAWDGRVWREDSTLACFNAVRKSLRPMGAKLLKRRRDLLSAKTVAAIERLARSDPRAAATGDQWDANDLVLNTPAGLVNLRTGAVAPNQPTTYATKITTAGPGGDCPRWQQFLDEVTGGDPELASFLQRVAGYAATGLTNEHALFFLYGRGANGKGTFLNTLVKLLGDYATVAPMETFTETHGERHPTELAMLRMIRLVVSQETEEGRRWAESRIKGMTGGDPITARFMRQDFFTFEPKFKLLIAGNHKPKLVNVDEAMRRRLHLIPFTVEIPKPRRDRNLAATLATEADGIMAWIIQGAVDYLRVGLEPPKAVSEATEGYFGDEDMFSQWLDDRCDKGLDHWATGGRLFASWKQYADAANIRAGDQRTFAARLEAAGFEAGNSRAKGGRHWLGLRLTPTETDPGPEGWDQQ